MLNQVIHSTEIDFRDSRRSFWRMNLESARISNRKWTSLSELISMNGRPLWMIRIDRSSSDNLSIRYASLVTPRSRHKS